MSSFNSAAHFIMHLIHALLAIPWLLHHFDLGVLASPLVARETCASFKFPPPDDTALTFKLNFPNINPPFLPPFQETGKLLYLMLGIGTQHYICTDTSNKESTSNVYYPTHEDVAFYDVSCAAENVIHQLPTQASEPGFNGDHQWTFAGTLDNDYTFNMVNALQNANAYVKTTMLDSIPSPDSTNNVPWQRCDATNGAEAGGLLAQRIYRTDTLGGQPKVKTCTLGDTQAVPFTALYWFY